MAIEKAGLVKLYAVGAAARELANARSFRSGGQMGLIRQGIDGGADRLRIAASFVGGGIERVAAAVSDALKVIMPKMVTSERLSFSIMKSPVTVAMFRQFVEEEATKPDGYRITGNNSGKLKKLLADPKKSDRALTYVSYDDATAFINWRKEKTGQDLRIPTDSEWGAAKREVGKQLMGDFWEWTKKACGASKIVRTLFDGGQYSHIPAYRYYDVTLRLVENIKK